MNQERWERVRQIFGEAIELSHEERERFLSLACANDAELLQELKSLLASRDTSSDFLARLDLDHITSSITQLSHDTLIGKLLGPYRIVRQVAHGGMGEVYEAMRDDGQFKKRVALKLVRYGMSREEILRRFRIERQTLATLEHPNIARLLDGGTTDEGVPFLVMEFVEGTRIDEYCDAHQLSIAERLKLFRVVCSAVQYAHQQLVVHRDLKPGNILVTTDGTPKLLDFGIAKLLTDESPAQLEEMTKTGAAVFTPEYASPEQVRGEKVTTISDVYSLGVLLYKLLTGQKPYEFKSPLAHDVTRAILEDDATKPSTKEPRIKTHESNDKLNRLLSGDLDTIVLKALQKDPVRRYTSIEQFAEDIRRHQSGLPVLAQDDTVGYRFSKFINRHRVGTAATAIVLLALVGGILGVYWQANEAARERDRARTEATKASQIVSFLNQMLSAADPFNKGKNVTVGEILDDAAKRVDRELLAQPEVNAAIRATIGTTYQNLGVYDAAEPQLRKSLDLNRRVYGDEHGEVAESLHKLALILHYKGDVAAAESLYTLSLDMFHRLGDTMSVRYVGALSDRGDFAQENSRNDEAEAISKRALDIARQLPGDNRTVLASILNNLAVINFRKKNLDVADSLYQQSLEIVTSLYGHESIYTSYILNNLSSVKEERGDLAGAEQFARACLAIRRKIFGNEHPSVAVSLFNLAYTLSLRTTYPEAEVRAREALAIANKVYRTPHFLTANIYDRLGKILLAKGEFKDAELNTRKSIAVRSQISPLDKRRIALTEIDLGLILVKQIRFGEAQAVLQKSYNTLLLVGEEGVSDSKRAARALSELYRAMGKKKKEIEKL